MRAKTIMMKTMMKPVQTYNDEDDDETIMMK